MTRLHAVAACGVGAVLVLVLSWSSCVSPSRDATTPPPPIAPDNAESGRGSTARDRVVAEAVPEPPERGGESETASADPARVVRLRGEVVGLDGEPAAGAVIEVTDLGGPVEPFGRVVSGAGGQFELRLPVASGADRPGNADDGVAWSVQARHAESVRLSSPAVVSVSTAVGDASRFLRLTLRPAAQLSGRLVTRAGEPVAGFAEVEPLPLGRQLDDWPRDLQRTTTVVPADAGGAFRVMVRPGRGRCWGRSAESGFSAACEYVAAQGESVDLGAVVVDPVACIAAVVVVDPAGAPVRGARVESARALTAPTSRASTRASFTDGSGRSELRLPQGLSSVPAGVSHPEFVPADVELRVDVPAPGPLRVTLTPRPRIRLRLRCAEVGTLPADVVEVSVMGGMSIGDAVRATGASDARHASVGRTVALPPGYAAAAREMSELNRLAPSDAERIAIRPPWLGAYTVQVFIRGLGSRTVSVDLRQDAPDADLVVDVPRGREIVLRRPERSAGTLRCWTYALRYQGGERAWDITPAGGTSKLHTDIDLSSWLQGAEPTIRLWIPADAHGLELVPCAGIVDGVAAGFEQAPPMPVERGDEGFVDLSLMERHLPSQPVGIVVVDEASGERVPGVPVGLVAITPGASAAPGSLRWSAWPDDDGALRIDALPGTMSVSVQRGHAFQGAREFDVSERGGVGPIDLRVRRVR